MRWMHKVGPRAYRFGAFATWFVAILAILVKTPVIELIVHRTPLAATLGVDPHALASISGLVVTGAVIVCAVRFHYWLHVGRLNRLGIKRDAETFSTFLSGYLRRFRGPPTDAGLIARVHARGGFTQSELDSVARHWDRDGWLEDGASESEKRSP